MVTPIVRRSNNQSSPEKANSLPLATRRFAAWVAEITLVVTSGLVPFGLGVYANSRSDLNRVPLNPLLVVTERAIARPLALPVSYGIRNVATPTNILWTLALLAPVTLTWWQLYLLTKTGSTIPKRWFGVRVVNEQGTPPSWAAVLLREGVGRTAVPLSVAYLLWRYSFLFPHVGIFGVLALLIVLGEGIGSPSAQGRRSLHDRIAGTYTIDANGPLPLSLSGNNKGTISSVNSGTPEPSAENQLGTILPSSTETSVLYRWLLQNPNQTLLVMAVFGMASVLTTLVGTQVYIQSQQAQQRSEQINSQQFLALVQQLNPNSNASDEERRSAILAMGTLNNQQSMKFLADLLVKENNPVLQDTIQQALINTGPQAILELKRVNHFLTSELQSANNAPQEREVQLQRLQINQRAISKILAVYSGKTKGIDLSRSQLGQSVTSENSVVNLVLDNVDLSGVKFKSANLNQGSFKGSRFRSVGEDGRWDTYDDVIADLTQVEMKQANLTDANLSRVIMNRSDLSRATLNRANLSNTRLFGANLSSTQLVGADLTGAILENASFTGADLSDAKLNEADLYGARLGRVTAIGTQLSYANLIKTDWQGSDLSNVYLDRANLSNANLSEARLTGAVLRSAQLQNANLQNADLTHADLQGANVAGADFRGTILSPTKQDPADQFVQVPEQGSQSALVQGVDFSQAKNLDSKQLAYICTQGGIHPRCP